MTTRRVNAGQYRDDLRFDSEARPYRPSSTRAGREGSRNVPAPERPNVKRRPQPNRSRDLRSRNNQPQASGFAGFIQAFTSDPRRVVALIAIALAVVLIIIISSSVRSCASSKNDNGKVDVVTAVTSDAAAAEHDIAVDDKGMGKIIEEEIERIKAENPELAAQVEREMEETRESGPGVDDEGAARAGTRAEGVAHVPASRPRRVMGATRQASTRPASRPKPAASVGAHEGGTPRPSSAVRQAAVKMAPRFCPNCGNEFSPGTKFCCYCGAKLPSPAPR